MPIYAIPGSAEFEIASRHLKLPGTVEMSEPNPNTEIYVASADGTWVIKDYATARRVTILKEWPTYKQLEALTEDAEGRPEKLNELKAFILKVKEEYPKSN